MPVLETTNNVEFATDELRKEGTLHIISMNDIIKGCKCKVTRLKMGYRNLASAKIGNSSFAPE